MAKRAWSPVAVWNPPCTPVHAPFEQAIAPSSGARLEGEAEAARLRAGANGRPDHRRAAVGKPRVGVHEDEDLSGGGAGPGGELGAAIRVGRQDAAVARRDRRRTIPAASVDHDDLGIEAESGFCPPERLIQARFLIERRHDDGEFRSRPLGPRWSPFGGLRLPCHPRSGSSRISRSTPFSERGCRNAMRAPPAPRRIRGGMASAPGRFGVREGSLEIVDADADVVDARAAPVEEAGDGRLRHQGSEQLDPPGALAEERGPNALGRNGFLPGRRLAEDRGPLQHGFRQRVDRDSHVIDNGRARNTVALVHCARRPLVVTHARERIPDPAREPVRRSGSSGRVSGAAQEQEIRMADAANGGPLEITDANFAGRDRGRGRSGDGGFLGGVVRPPAGSSGRLSTNSRRSTRGASRLGNSMWMRTRKPRSASTSARSRASSSSGMARSWTLSWGRTPGILSRRRSSNTPSPRPARGRRRHRPPRFRAPRPCRLRGARAHRAANGRRGRVS